MQEERSIAFGSSIPQRSFMCPATVKASTQSVSHQGFVGSMYPSSSREKKYPAEAALEADTMWMNPQS